MKDEIKENNSVMKCCICNNENIGEFIVIEDKKYHLNCITNLQEENERLKELNVCVGCNNNPDYKSRNEKAIEYNNQVIKDTKDFYRPTSDVIYSGDTLIDIAMQNINILNGGDEEC